MIRWWLINLNLAASVEAGWAAPSCHRLEPHCSLTKPLTAQCTVDTTCDACNNCDAHCCTVHSGEK